MNINKIELEELNKLLKSTNIDLPAHRREISQSGRNYQWLQEHIQDRNPGISTRIKELLHIK